MKIISRKEAKEQGLTWYFTGNECPNGHNSKRRVSNSCCYTCSTARDSKRKYNEKYKERSKLYSTEYNIKNKEHIKVKQKEYYLNNKEHINEYNNTYNKDNSERYKILGKQYRDNNKEHIKQYNQKYVSQNRAKINTLNAYRRAMKIQATVSWADITKIKDTYEDCQELNMCTKLAGGTEPFHVDHIIPLVSNKVCGLHVEYNLQIITASENLSKGNTWNSDG